MEFKATIKNKIGINAKPALVLTATAAAFRCDIKLIWKDKEADLKSILNVMSLGVKAGDEVTVVAKGDDESEAIEAVKQSMIDTGLI